MRRRQERGLIGRRAIGLGGIEVEPQPVSKAEVSKAEVSKAEATPRLQRWLQLWDNGLSLLSASLIGVTIALAGPIAWLLLWRLNLRILPRLPWAAALLSLTLVVGWRWLVGPRTSRAATWARDKLSLRSWPIPAATPWALVGVVAITSCALSSIFLGLRIGHFTPDAFAPSAGYEVLGPSLTISKVVMTSLVAGVFEELGFRGCMQPALAKRFGAGWAIFLTSLLFYCMHLSHDWARGDLVSMLAIGVPMVLSSVLFGVLAFSTQSIGPSMLAHTLTDLIALPLEWQLAGSYDLTPLSTTGVDRQFVLCTLVFSLTLALGVYSLFQLARFPRSVRTEQAR